MPKIFSPHLTQGGGRRTNSGIDASLYTQLTDKLLSTFYPKSCCGETLTEADGKRNLNLRCPHCHRQVSRFKGTPLQHLKLPRWMFSYALRESVLQHPAVLTSSQISRRLGIKIDSAITLKRRIQIFASEQLPRMQRVFHDVMSKSFYGFEFPHDRNTDLTEMVKDIPIPQVDTVVLYSCSTRANKGRKRWKRTGQTSSIYMSESLGGEQKGLLVNTLGVKNGPSFFDSIGDQRVGTINPIIRKYLPHNAPLFSDMGYRGYTGRNLRMVNHSARSTDSRYRYAKNRFSKNGIHCQVAEGLNSLVKSSFAAYRWIHPKNSILYLNEFAFIRNLKFIGVEEMLKVVPVRKVTTPKPRSLREFGGSICPKFFSYSPRKPYFNPNRVGWYRLTSLTIQP